jgi:hypothetical protein
MADIKLTIRNEQIHILEDDILRRWIEKYLVSCYPQRVEAMGPKAFGELVEEGMKAGRKRGFATPGEVRKYVHVMFLLGLHFESDSRFGWARKILDDPKYRIAGARLRELEDGVLGLTKGIAPNG